MSNVLDQRSQLRVGLKTDVGLQRSANEDSLGSPQGLPADVLAHNGWLYAVADGMGGHVAGRAASETAVTTALAEYYREPTADPGASLKVAVEQANAAVHAGAQESDKEGMGTTLVAALLRGNELYVANVGDSRAYLIRAKRIRQITLDHSWVAEQRRAGILTEEEAKNHPYANVITRALGMTPDVQVDLFRETLQPGDTVLLCSDGLWGAVSNLEMLRSVAGREPQQATEDLVALANQRGGNDNITVAVIRLDQEQVALLVQRPVLVGAVVVAVSAIALALALFRPPQVPPASLKSTIIAQRPTGTSTSHIAATWTATRTHTPTQTPTLLPTSTLVPTSLDIELHWLVQVVVTGPVNLRREPKTSSELLGEVCKGDRLFVVGGPKYEDALDCQPSNRRWWKVWVNNSATLVPTPDCINQDCWIADADCKTGDPWLLRISSSSQTN